MKPLPQALQDHLAGGVTTVCQCWQITDRNGRVLGFTDHDRALEFEGVVHQPETGFTGTAIEQTLGLAVDTQDVSGVLTSGLLSEQDLAAGVFDDAEIVTWLVNWNDVAQRVMLRAGNLGEVTRGPVGFTAEVRGLSHRLNQPQGRLFQYGCDAELGDARCGADTGATSFQATVIIASVVDARRFMVTGAEGFAQGWFERGTLTFTGNPLSTGPLRISSHTVMGTSVLLELEAERAGVVAPGYAAVIVAGCDKHFSTCCDKFGNAANFRGFPHMPGNDFVTYYPVPGEGNGDG